MRLRWLVFTAALFVLGSPGTARANMSRTVDDGDRAGALIPESAAGIRVDAETLRFEVAADLAVARVTASYRMTNTTGAVEAADIAFAFVRGSHRNDHDLGPHAGIQVDHVAVATRVRTDADVLAPRLQAWLAAHPDLKDKLAVASASGDGDRGLVAPVAAAGGKCDLDCGDLVRWYQQTTRDVEPGPAKEYFDGLVLSAAREALPGASDEITRGWTTSTDRPAMSWLLFHVDFAPGQSRTIDVAYEQQATEDRALHVNTTFSFDYLLSPAKRWASFGPLDVEVDVPADVLFTSPAPFHADGSVQRASFATLPGGELHFDVMSRAGLWFGMATPGGYWAILVVAMMLVALGLGAAMGRLWTARPRRQRTLLRVFVAGPLAALGSGVALLLVSAVFPARALGYGYGSIFGSLLLLLLAIPAGALASAYAPSRAARWLPRA